LYCNFRCDPRCSLPELNSTSAERASEAASTLSLDGPDLNFLLRYYEFSRSKFYSYESYGVLSMTFDDGDEIEDISHSSRGARQDRFRLAKTPQGQSEGQSIIYQVDFGENQSPN
jgi:hypothetical protein